MKPLPTIEERFLQKVKILEGGCWYWTAAKSKGYGRFTDNGKQVVAHRWAYEHFIGPIPEGKHLDHLCRNRSCVNPAHLEPVTPLVNCLRSENLSFKAHINNTCLRGHPLSADNVYLSKRGTRRCKTYQNAWLHAHKEEINTRRRELRSKRKMSHGVSCAHMGAGKRVLAFYILKGI